MASGYLFGDQEIYNPFSVTRFAAESQERECRYDDVHGEYDRVQAYAVAFHRKRCRVRLIDLPQK